MPKLTLKFKDSVLADYHLPKGCSLKIGRGNDNDVVIENLAVSGHHAKIDSVGDGFVFIDLKSKNGSFVNEQLVNSHWLEDGDIINIGKHLLVFSYFEDELRSEDNPSEIDKTMVMDTNQYRSMRQKSEPKPAPALETAPATVPAPEPAPEFASTPSATTSPKKKKKPAPGYLIYLAGGNGKFGLKRKLTKIGKDPACDIVVKGLMIGKTAAVISRTRDGYFLSYVGGLSKPKINEQKVAKQAVKLNDSDIINIGSIKLQFQIKKKKPNPAV